MNINLDKYNKNDIKNQDIIVITAIDIFTKQPQTIPNRIIWRSNNKYLVHTNHTLKANPSPNGNGFAFNLFGERANTRVETQNWNMWRYFGVFTACA